MKAAIDAAEAQGTDVALVDRDIQVTMQRFWTRLSFLEKLKLVASMAVGLGDPREVGMGVGVGFALMISIVAGAVAGPFVVPAGLGPGVLVAILDTLVVGLGLGLVLGTLVVLVLARLAPEEDELDEFDIERMTDTDVVGAMMEEFRRFSPGGAEALIDERDAYIAHRLVALREAGYHVVAVVGAGHREGIEGYLERPATLPPMSELTGRATGRRFSVYKLFGYLFTLGFLVFFLLLAVATYTGVEGTSSGLLFRLFAAWFLVNGIIAFVLAKLAGAHWQSAGVGGGTRLCAVAAWRFAHARTRSRSAPVSLAVRASPLSSSTSRYRIGSITSGGSPSPGARPGTGTGTVSNSSSGMSRKSASARTSVS